MDLFFSRMSGNSARAVFGLLEIGAPWTPHPVDPRAAESRSPDYLALNPMGKVPALRDGSLNLWESNAINLYVAEKHPARGLIPAALEARASLHRWLFFQTGHVSPACVVLFRATNPRVQAFWKSQTAPESADAARKELARFLPVLDGALREREWLEGDFSLADVAYAPHFFLIAGGGFDFSPYPRLQRWFERILDRPAWRDAAQLVFGN